MEKTNGKYHMTENKYLDSISRNGLTPQRGSRSQLIGDKKCAVFYSEGYAGVLTMFFKMVTKYQKFKDSESNVHTQSYNDLKRKLKELKNGSRSKYREHLMYALRSERKISRIIDRIRRTKNYRDFFGEGVCLSLKNVVVKNIFEGKGKPSFDNSWTIQTVEPQNINVVALVDKENGEVLSSKYDVIMFFASKIRKFLHLGNYEKPSCKSVITMVKYYVNS